MNMEVKCKSNNLFVGEFYGHATGSAAGSKFSIFIRLIHCPIRVVKDMNLFTVRCKWCAIPIDMENRIKSFYVP